MDRLTLDLISIIQYNTIFQPADKKELEDAVGLLIDSVVSNQKYGHISYWNTSIVTDMSYMFWNETDH